MGLEKLSWVGRSVFCIGAYSKSLRIREAIKYGFRIHLKMNVNQFGEFSQALVNPVKKDS